MAPDDLDHLYRAQILEHSRNPRNHEQLDAPDIEGDAVNPFCGDEVYVQVKLDGDMLSAIGVQSAGCAINRASASMMSEAVRGRTAAEATEFETLFRELMAGAPLSPAERGALGEICALEAVRAFPVRVKCALLPWTALEDALGLYR